MKLGALTQLLHRDPVAAATKQLDAATEVVQVLSTGGRTSVSSGEGQRASRYAAGQIEQYSPVLAPHLSPDAVAALDDLGGHVADLSKIPTGSPAWAAVAPDLDGITTLLRRSRAGSLDAAAATTIAADHGFEGAAALAGTRDARLGIALLGTAARLTADQRGFAASVARIDARLRPGATAGDALATSLDALQASAASGTGAGQRLRAVHDVAGAARSALGDVDSPTLRRFVPSGGGVGLRSTELDPEVTRRAAQLDVVAQRLGDATPGSALHDQLHVAAIASSLGALPDDGLAMLAVAERAPAQRIAVAERLTRLAGAASGASVDAEMGRQSLRELADLELRNLPADADADVADRAARLRGDARLPDGGAPLERAARIVRSGDAGRVVLWAPAQRDATPSLVAASVLPLVDDLRATHPEAAAEADDALATFARHHAPGISPQSISTLADTLDRAARGEIAQKTPTAAAAAATAGDALATAPKQASTSIAATLGGASGAHPLLARIAGLRTDLETVVARAQEASDGFIRGRGSRNEALDALARLRTSITHADALAGDLHDAGAPVAAGELRSVSVRLESTWTELDRYARHVRSESKVINHAQAGRRLANVDYVAMLASGELAGADPAAEAAIDGVRGTAVAAHDAADEI